MIYVILIAIAILMIFSVVVRTILLNLHFTLFYLPKDIFNYFRYHLFDSLETGRLICYTALFGGGKTLSCVHYVLHLYKRYNNKKIFDINKKRWVTQKVHVISNVDLCIPFEKFESLQQIIDAAEYNKIFDDKHDTRTCTIVLGDEFSVQMNSRSFKTNIDPIFLNTLLTCRHHHILFVYNAQRFQHVDKLLRGVTSHVIECKKIWRVCVQCTYDAWVLENCSDPTVIKPIARHGWFIRDKDFAAYDTLACVGNLIKSVRSGDMESEKEILDRLGDNDIDVTEGAYKKKVLRRLRKR